MIRTALLAFLLLFSREVKAQIVGVSYLALQGFNEQQCSTALKVFDGVEYPYIAFLWGTFGASNACIDRFIGALGTRKATIEIYAANETCKRKPRRCYAADQPDFHKRAQVVARFIGKRLSPQISWLVSPGLEDDLSQIVYKNRMRALKYYMPQGVDLVRNPNAKTNLFTDADYIELHAAKWWPAKRKCIYSNDGLDIYFGNGIRATGSKIQISDLLGSIRGAERSGCNSLIWWNTQGIERRFVEPSRRNFRIYSKDVNAVNALLRGLQNEK